MDVTGPKDDGKAEAAKAAAKRSRSARAPVLAPEITPAQQKLLDWTNLRSAWFRSGFTGYEDGQPLPPLGPRPPDPPVVKRKRARR